MEADIPSCLRNTDGTMTLKLNPSIFNVLLRQLMRLSLFLGRNPDALQLTLKVAQWTITNMQDNDGYFYHRRHSKRWVKKDAHAALGPGDDALRPRGPVQRLCNQKRMA